jgi:hypothetical protein
VTMTGGKGCSMAPGAAGTSSVGALAVLLGLILLARSLSGRA